MDFPSNSDKARNPAVQRPKKKKIEKVVTLDVTVRKRSLAERFKDVFIGGESKAAVRYIGYEVLLPALRNMIVDATTKGIERVIYGDVIQPRRSYGSDTRVQYNSPVSRYNGRSSYSNSPIHRPHQSRSSARYEVMELIFPTRDEANRVLEMMLVIIEAYDVASVAELHELAGLPINHTDNKWGWSDLRSVDVKQTRDGFVIDFPPVEPC